MKNIFKDLDKAFENRIRLGIMSILMVNDSVSFNDLKEMLDSTDGNLASHIKYLEKKEYISIHKSFLNRKPNTTYMASDRGRAAFKKHVDAIGKML